MYKNYTIMCEDIPVVYVNHDLADYDILCEELLPFVFKGVLRKVPVYDTYTSKQEFLEQIAITNCNSNAHSLWMTYRTLPLSRKNAKWLYNTLRIEQCSNYEQQIRFAEINHFTSVLDNYWIRFDNESCTWSSVNIRNNILDEPTRQIALHGKSVKLQGSLITPELTTNGAYAKAWKRHPDSKL